jgi:hypothetical protein
MREVEKILFLILSLIVFIILIPINLTSGVISSVISLLTIIKNTLDFLKEEIANQLLK